MLRIPHHHQDVSGQHSQPYERKLRLQRLPSSTREDVYRAIAIGSACGPTKAISLLRKEVSESAHRIGCNPCIPIAQFRILDHGRGPLVETAIFGRWVRCW
jgi:hypothetical protein